MPVKVQGLYQAVTQTVPGVVASKLFAMESAQPVLRPHPEISSIVSHDRPHKFVWRGKSSGCLSFQVKQSRSELANPQIAFPALPQGSDKRKRVLPIFDMPKRVHS